MTWRNTGAVLSGVLIMVLVDLLFARIVPTVVAPAIAVSVFSGSVITGLIVGKNGWVWGLLVGLVNSLIAVGLFYGLSDRASMYDVVVQPVLLSITFSISGGAIGGWVRQAFQRRRLG
jgi:putative membrane protein (TIGR04086 family)